MLCCTAADMGAMVAARASKTLPIWTVQCVRPSSDLTTTLTSRLPSNRKKKVFETNKVPVYFNTSDGSIDGNPRN